MKTSRKKLITHIAMTEKILQHQQLNVQKNKSYLINKITDYRLVILVTLLPAFIWGWKNGKLKGREKIIKQLIRFLLFTSFTFAKRQFLMLVSNK